MQSPITHNEIYSAEILANVGEVAEVKEQIWFQTHFTGHMEMYANADIVAQYFDDHGSWFPRCAQPMKTEAIGSTGYALTIGKFGALGYQIEPKVGLDLLPEENGVYLIQTIPVPNYTAPGYEVNFKAAQVFVETEAYFTDKIDCDKMTRVEWQLDLSVGVYFPKFILNLPRQKVKNAGDKLLAEIVKGVSKKLTYKVQEDFHHYQGNQALEVFKCLVAHRQKIASCELVS